MGTLEAAREALANEWERRNPVDEAGIAAFYRDSECLADDLEAWHSLPQRQAWTRAIVEVAERNGVQTVLDVGAGGAHDLRALLEKLPDQFGGMWSGLEGVEPNQRLSRTWPNQIGWHPSLAHVDSGLRSDLCAQYDMVICIDVLEHVPDPEALLKDVMSKVKMGGLLIEATATHDQGTPLHLPELQGWEATPTLQKAGFVAREQFGRLAVWQKEEPPPGTLLVVAHRQVTVPTVESLFEMVGRGWPIAFAQGDADVGRARSKAASQWFKDEPTDVFLMIDDDIVFTPEDVEKVIALAAEKRSIAVGAYPVMGGGHLASRAWPGQVLHFTNTAEPVEIRWPAGGFMAAHRDVVEAMVETLPLCYPQAQDGFWPMFQEFPYDDGTQVHYLSEDYAFGQRAMDLGFTTWLEPSVVLTHLKVQGISVLTMDGAKKEKP